MFKRSLFRDIAGVFGSNVFAVLGVFIISILLTRNLGPAGFGAYTALLVIPMVVIAFFQLGIRRSLLYHFGRKAFDVQQMRTGLLLLMPLLALPAMAVNILAFALYSATSFHHSWVVLVTLLIPFQLVLTYISGYFLGRDQMALANALRWGPVVLQLLVLLGIYLFGELTVESALWAFLLSVVPVALWALFRVLGSGPIQWQIPWAFYSSLFKLGLVYALSFVVLQLNYRIDILLVSRISGATEAGWYALAATLAEQIWQLPQAIGIVLMSRVAMQPEKSAKSAATVARMGLLLSMLGAGLVLLAAPFLLPLIYGEAFRASVQMLMALLPGILAMVVFRILNGQMSGLGKPQLALYVFLPMLMVNILLNLLWIPRFGAMGAAWATNVSYLCGTLVFVWYWSKYNGLSPFAILQPIKSDFQQIKDKFAGRWKR